MEYQNELQRPVLFGTRRVGPDLSREGGRRPTTGTPFTSTTSGFVRRISHAGLPLVL